MISAKKYIRLSVTFLTLSVVGILPVGAQNDSTLVNIGYVTQPQWMRTAAISSISNDELTRTTASTAVNSLQGLLPGLTMMRQSGQPGYDFSIEDIYMRGRTTYNSGQKILVFIDGFESSAESLSASEIESVTLLKDASALAIYGSRGANGVLLITTKRGLESKPDIRVRIQSGIQSSLKMPGTVDSYTYASLYNQACVNDGLQPAYSQEALEHYRTMDQQYLYPNVNWRNDLLRKVAPISLADLSFRGGNRIVKYYVHLGVADTRGFFKGTDSKKDINSNSDYTSVNVRSNIDIRLSKRFTVAFNFGGKIGSKSFPGGGASSYSIFNSMYRVAPNAFPVHNPDGTYGGNASQTNPVGELLGRGVYKDLNRSFQIVFTPKLDLDFITKGLNLNASVAYSNYMSETSTKKSNYARYSLSTDSEGNYIYTPFGTDEPLEAGEGFNTDWSRINVKAALEYARTFGNHDIMAEAFALLDNYREYTSRPKTRYANFALRATYSYKRKYIAEATVSYCGCDDYAPGHRFSVYPALSLGWNLTEEPWLKNSRAVNRLKLRLSAGMTGNNQNPNGKYLFSETYASTGSYLFGTGSSSTTAFGTVSVANPELAPEKEYVFNAGIDAKLFQGLYATLDVFTKTRKGIVSQAEATTPGFVGSSDKNSLPWVNAGTVRNSGFELALDWRTSASGDIDWSVGAGVWYARNTIVEMGEATRAYDYQYRKGHPVGTPFVLVAEGLYDERDFETDGTLKNGLAVPQFGQVRPGDIRYNDRNGDKVIDSNDAVPFGYSDVPEWNFTLSGSFRWKHLNIELMFQGTANRDLWLSGNSVWSFYDNGSASVLSKDSWTSENRDASYPRLSTTNFSNNYRTSTFWRKSGSYLRLKNLYISYDFPINRFLKDISLYLNGTDLFTIDSLGGFADPESSSPVTYPLSRTVSLGLKFTF